MDIVLVKEYGKMKQKISITVNDKILRDVDSIVDNIFVRNRSQAFEYLIEKALKESKIAVILAGEGKNPVNKIKSRYALKVGYLTIIERAIKKLSDSGFRDIYIVAPHKTLTNIFKIIGDGSDYKAKIKFVDEEVQEGSASALKLLRGKIKTTFLVVHCDLIFDYVNLLELWQQHLQEKMLATILVSSRSIGSITSKDRGMFGHVHLEGHKVLSFTEKPTPRKLKSSIFFGGIFVAEPEIFGYGGKSLEFDVFPELVKRGFLGGQMGGSEHLHIHTHKDLINVRKKLRERK